MVEKQETEIEAKERSNDRDSLTCEAIRFAADCDKGNGVAERTSYL